MWKTQRKFEPKLYFKLSKAHFKLKGAKKQLITWESNIFSLSFAEDTKATGILFVWSLILTPLFPFMCSSLC